MHLLKEIDPDRESPTGLNLLNVAVTQTDLGDFVQELHGCCPVQGRIDFYVPQAIPGTSMHGQYHPIADEIAGRRKN